MTSFFTCVMPKINKEFECLNLNFLFNYKIKHKCAIKSLNYLYFLCGEKEENKEPQSYLKAISKTTLEFTYLVYFIDKLSER